MKCFAPRQVLFGEPLPKPVVAEAKRLMLGADGLLIVGTSLNVYPAATYPNLVRASGPSHPIVEINAIATNSVARPDVMITGRAGVWLTALANRLVGKEETPWRPVEGGAPRAALGDAGRESRQAMAGAAVAALPQGKAAALPAYVQDMICGGNEYGMPDRL